MSVKTEIKSGAMSPRHLEAGINKHLKKALVAQGLMKEGDTLSFKKGEGEVRMHGSERAKANWGVVSFSDTPYQVGISMEGKEFSFVYDSWVDGGSLNKRVNGPSGDRSRPHNFCKVEEMSKTQDWASSIGSTAEIAWQKDGGVLSFVAS